MKKILILLSLIIVAVCFYSCRNDEELHKMHDYEYSVVSLENDPLIINLKNLNDSLLQSKDSTIESRGIRDFFNNLKQIAVIYADIKGAIVGAKLGLKWGKGNGVLSAIVGSVVFASVMSALYSAMAAITNGIPNMDQGTYIFEQEQVELAYVNSRLRENLISEELERCSQVKINIPQKNKKDYEAGIYHNITLRFLVNDEKIYNYDLREALSNTEIRALHSQEFIESFDSACTHTEIYSLSYAIENPSKEERVVQLFLDAYKDYVDNLDDVNDLINNYIALIEGDRNISEEEKSVVYSALSTAAFSSNFWYQKYSRDNANSYR